MKHLRGMLLLAAAAVAPLVARADVPAQPGQLLDFVNYRSEPQWQASFVNAAMCSGEATLQLEWNLGTNPAQTGTYMLYASNVAPAAASGSALVLCPTFNDVQRNLMAGPIAGGMATQMTALMRSTTVSGSAAVMPSGFSCANENQVFYVCAHFITGALPTASAVGKFIIQTQAPEPPVGVTFSSLPGGLAVMWTPATDGGAAADHFVVSAVPVDADGQPVPGEVFRSAPVTGTLTELWPLGYDRRYRVTIVGYSVGGNPSAESAPVLAQTAPDYLNAPGVPRVRSNGGGCGTGGAGALSLVALAALARPLRRRN